MTQTRGMLDMGPVTHMPQKKKTIRTVRRIVNRGMDNALPRCATNVDYVLKVIQLYCA